MLDALALTRRKKLSALYLASYSALHTYIHFKEELKKMIKYIIYKHTQDYTKYLGYITVDNLKTALIFVETYLSYGYNVDIRIKQEKPL